MIRIACHLGFGHLKRLPSKSHLQVLSQPIPARFRPLLNPSRHHLNLPLTNLKVFIIIQRYSCSGPDDTLVDHRDMDVLLWWCQRPPIAILLGGRTHDSCPAALLLLCHSFSSSLLLLSINATLLTRYKCMIVTRTSGDKTFPKTFRDRQKLPHCIYSGRE